MGTGRGNLDACGNIDSGILYQLESVGGSGRFAANYGALVCVLWVHRQTIAPTQPGRLTDVDGLNAKVLPGALGNTADCPVITVDRRMCVGRGCRVQTGHHLRSEERRVGKEGR